ncbi:hypothetical protein B0A81_14870 [Flavobacterium plurextorum]|uniref:Uncharacterized protein n=1 Tax=Flavobacterium plurextorum TaxID=1114867 RepID=A0ABX4CRM4_9FLAO|nr:hypothetical protein B0A81_14870 [Flavobacterium plurextorum]
MKTINYINSFLLGIPLIIFILAFLKIIDLTVYGLLSVIFIGLFQIIVSGYMLFKVKNEFRKSRVEKFSLI